MRQNTVLLMAIFALWATLFSAAKAQQTQTQYLSGLGKDDAVPWDFNCTAGKQANQWTTIPVPSNWELHGFGVYSYGGYVAGPPGPRPTVTGRYKRAFSVPAAWAGRRTFLVFEGVMTDTTVQVNGQSAGPVHQGGYYQFRYEVTKLLKYGQQNLLEVTVTDESSNASVNNAERRGDYWNYAGIYRPVYLENVPPEFIERAAVNAKADGSFAVDVYGNGIARADRVEAQIQDTNGRAVGKPFAAPISADTSPVRLATLISAPRLWTAETPNLYQVQVRLTRGGTVLHEIHQRFGFRTIEVRPGDGIYVNGKRILLKGSCRHSFWPDSGRCLSEAISRQDITLMKDMNMNAVRMSHYPPDQHFLDDCDTMGLYVLDELGGWQHPYDTTIGHSLVQAMVTRDVNHPSVLFWDNANEGGWNRALDDDFAAWDPQGRHVIHPGGGVFRDIHDSHYQSYTATQATAAGRDVLLPTEFLHGLYDGGAGAGLADYWDVIRQSKVGGGGFIWAFLDEAVKRMDQDGHLDTHGNQAPDGILGPYREKEGSYYTIKEVWSPVVFTDGPALPPDFTGTLGVENRFDFTDLRQCRFVWDLRRFRRPADALSGFTVMSHGDATPAGSIPPGKAGALRLPLPANWRQADALAVQAQDPQGRELWTRVWPLPRAGDFRSLATAAGAGKVSATETPDQITVQSGALTVVLSKQTGQLVSVRRGGQLFSLTNGLRLAAGAGTLASIEQHTDGPDCVVSATYSGDMKTVRWRFRPNGWVQVDYAYSLTGPQDFFGVSFDYPEANVKSLKWLGDGPYRTWKNRRAGGTLSVWQNAYNNTITGDALWQYPEFKGYYGGVRWAQLGTTEGPITAVLGEDTDFLQVLTPQWPPPRQVGNTAPPFPAAGLSFLQAIPPMGSKFSKAEGTGPQGQQTVATGDYHGSVSLFFGELPK